MRETAFTTEYSLYCLQCGNKGLPIARRLSNKKEKFHRKKLYCIYCKEEVNHIECKNLEEVKKFKQKFKRGDYLDEAKKSVHYVRSSRRR